MVDAFATADEFAQRMNRVFTGDELTWIGLLLEDASTYLREDVLGMQVWPQSQALFTAWPDGGRVDMPQQPVVSIDSVQRDGVDVEYRRRDSTIYVYDDDPVDVTFTFGYVVAPDSLKRWTYVLVSQVLLTLEQQLGLTAGGLSSVQLDDFKAAWADAGDNSGITLSDRNIALIREQFGAKSTHVVSTV